MYRLININCEILTLQPKWMKIIRYICMKDDLQLGKLKENCLLLKLYRKLRKMFTAKQQSRYVRISYQ